MLSFCVERLARAERLQHVVHLREGEAGVVRLSRLAMSAEVLGNRANFRLQCLRAVGEGEGVEATGLGVSGSIFESPARR